MLLSNHRQEHPLQRVIDYYFAPLSPWTYLGHDRFTAIARQAGATIRVRPVDMGAVFAVSGGLPLGQRPAQRQAYRLVELERFSRHLGVPLNVHPKFFPVPADPAGKLITAVVLNDGDDAALQLSGAVFRAVWVQDRDVSSPDVLAAIVSECGLPAARLAQSSGEDVKAAYEDNTRKAIEAQIFGAPSYVLDGEIFWGQDRLDFLQRALAKPAP
jgi:2-hydroxychromene-2-carboxylate isomerase